MEKKSEDNNGNITDNTKVGMPLWRFISVLVVIVVAVFSLAMAYSDLTGNDKEAKQCIEKKLDKSEFEQYKFERGIEQKELNRKIDLIMEHFKIKDYGQSIEKY